MSDTYMLEYRTLAPEQIEIAKTLLREHRTLSDIAAVLGCLPRDVDLSLWHYMGGTAFNYVLIDGGKA
jgi:hypothetical protein